LNHLTEGRSAGEQISSRASVASSLACEPTAHRTGPGEDTTVTVQQQHRCVRGHRAPAVFPARLNTPHSQAARSPVGALLRAWAVPVPSNHRAPALAASLGRLARIRYCGVRRSRRRRPQHQHTRYGTTIELTLACEKALLPRNAVSMDGYALVPPQPSPRLMHSNPSTRAYAPL
jgi:hypothetical protein